MPASMKIEKVADEKQCIYFAWPNLCEICFVSSYYSLIWYNELLGKEKLHNQTCSLHC